MKTKNTWSIHPGEILREEFLKPLKITVYRLAKETHVSATRLNEIVHEKRSVSVDTAMRLAKFFGTTAQFWLSLQITYDLKNISSENAKAIGEIHPCVLKSS